MFDIWSKEIDIAKNVYERDNYTIKLNPDCRNGICYIFFSSNNIWFPNTEEAFRRSFVDNDYYEWYKFDKLSAEKFIFVRDIYKSWYVSGINSRINSIDALLSLLKQETQGMKIITVGSSAGGYMAALAAVCLDADYSISFSPQFDLSVKGVLGVNPLLKKYQYIFERSRYYQIGDIIKNSETDIFYFMPVYCKQDLEQLEKVAEFDNVHIIKIASKHHGIPLFTGNLYDLLCLDKKELKCLFTEYNNKIIDMISISIRLSGMRGTFIAVYKDLLKLIKKKIRRGSR